ncbi:helix-turn-helix transcriptional regulator [Virgisporangium aurantiacum]|uniref:WYL domain-containing protein n=1 Tax=Virgisporangium aurantiacum TaxID=175570 RepID=A0A8J4DYJ2_9ACTN|nr:WYL domain-containing protein [Virgisporangium aurantiacum]GIJ54984.1 WYL domain-containing protein [Virgisporangium aurantiacum]
MSRGRTERLVNLVICLLSTRRFLTAAQIAATVPGYEHDPDDPREHDAFQRKFERDKSELRDLGVPLEIGNASVFDTEPGYRIARREYALPDIHLEPEEAAAVGIAARLWRHAGLAAAASSGLTKLRAAGVDVDPTTTLGVEPVVNVDPAFEPLTAAVRARQPVTFDYHPPEHDTTSTRRLQPWGVVCWRGKWYVVGHDLDRAAARCFRLSRVVGGIRRSGRAGTYEPPADLDLISYVARFSGPVERTHRATLLVRPDRAAGVRRWATEIVPGPTGDRVTLPFADADGFAGWLVGYGADVLVLEPPALRDRVIARLEQVSAGHPAIAPAQRRVPSTTGGRA